jgi:hypothetical protein
MSAWLPSLPASGIHAGVLEKFLKEGHPESNTHEYKLVGATKRLPEVVSALANTYGGVVIIGVPDEWGGDFATLGNVDATSESRIVDQLIGDLDPNWLPIFIPVEVDGHRLLVLKVDAGDAPRPLLAGGRGYLKREKRKVPASWFDLRALYAAEQPRTPAVPSLHARFLSNLGDVSYILGGSADQPQFVWRIVAGCPAWPIELRGRHANASLRNQIRASLTATPLDGWIRAFGSEHDLTSDDGWRDVPPSHIGTASFLLAATRNGGNRRGPRAAAHLQLDVSDQPHGPSGGGIAATINLMLWPTSLAEDRSIAETQAIEQSRVDQYRRRLSLADIGATLDVLVLSVEAVLAEAKDALFDYPNSDLIGPNVWVVGDIAKLWDLTATGMLRPAKNDLGSHHAFDAPSAFPTAESSRQAVINTWLQNLLLAAGFVPSGPAWPST